jgi:hypothetical protein
MTRHQKKDIELAESMVNVTGEPSKVWQRQTAQTTHKREAEAKELQKVDDIIQNTVNVVEADVIPRQPYEIALDEFIALGADRLRHGDMQISASNFVAAIKAKIDHERNTKDRRLDMLKNMFTGAAPKGVEDGSRQA